MKRVLSFFLLFIALGCHGQPLCREVQSPTEYVGLGFLVTGLVGITRGIQGGLFVLTGSHHGESTADRIARIKGSLRQVGKLLVVSGSMAVTGLLLLDCSWNRAPEGNEKRLGRW